MGRIRQLAGALARLPEAAALLRKHGRPPAVMYFGGSPGDDLLATAVISQWKQTHGSRPWYLTFHPSLFAGHPDVALTAPYSPELAGALSALGIRRLRLGYHGYDAAQDRSIAAPDHIINLMCRSAGLAPLTDPSPKIYLSSAELARAGAAGPRLVVQSSVMGAAMPIRNKEWFPERMQLVVHQIGRRMEVVQLGPASDPPLGGATDMRGQTSLRDAAIVLAGAAGFVGMVGFLMHLARAVGTPSVVVFGGREHPSQSGYPGNRNLFTPLECSPCWLWNRCPYDRECMQRISVDEVVANVEALLQSRKRDS